MLLGQCFEKTTTEILIEEYRILNQHPQPLFPRSLVLFPQRNVVLSESIFRETFLALFRFFVADRISKIYELGPKTRPKLAHFPRILSPFLVFKIFENNRPI